MTKLTNTIKGVFRATAPNFIMLAMALIIAVLFLQKCEPDYVKAEPVAPTEIKKVETATAKHDRKDDSLKAEIARAKKSVDSANTVIKHLKAAMKYTLARAAEDAAFIELARTNKDTTSYIDRCNSLAEKVVQLQVDNDQKDKAQQTAADFYESVIDDQQEQISEKDSLLAVINKAFKTVAKSEIAKTNEANRWRKKNGKRITFGPSVTYGIDTKGRTGVVVGLSATYQLFKL